MIIIKSAKEIEMMRRPGRIVGEVLAEVSEKVKVGVTTQELDALAEELILRRGAKPAFKGYRGYPSTLCTSVNEEVVHGIPSRRKLREGDILSIDLGVFSQGYYGDAAVTLPVGNISKEAQGLIESTKRSLYKGIEAAVAGNRLYDVSFAVQKQAEGDGYSVVRDFVGHGIGTSLHEEPQVPNYGSPGKGPLLKVGMVLAIEPMINMKGYDVRVTGDDWTVVTVDGSLSAHFEHTVAIGSNGAVILTSI
ncbi:MAG: type I methionyl aminopeptidase [Nitrospinota bacterium]|nr:type I methionyl aminopeptidase [Nitrospinota bacterium]